METKGQKVSQKSPVSIVLYVAAAVVALIGIALLVTNVYQYTNALKQYVAQGYTAAEVASQLVPNQLLPAIFQAVGIYGGIAFVLVGVGIANRKASKCIALLANDQTCCEVVDGNTVQQDEVVPEIAQTSEEPENSETTEQSENTENK